MYPLLTEQYQQHQQHQQLVELLDELDQSVLKNASPNQLCKQLNQFIDLAIQNFQSQEIVMEQLHFSETYTHSEEHHEIVTRLRCLVRKLSKDSIPFQKCHMKIFRTWLEMHLIDTDNRLDAFLHPYRIELPKRTTQNKATLTDVYLEF